VCSLAKPKDRDRVQSFGRPISRKHGNPAGRNNQS